MSAHHLALRFSPSLRSPSTAWSRDTTGQQRDSRNSRRPLGDSYGDGAPMNGSRAGSRPRTPSSHFTVQLPPVLPSGRRSRRVSPIQITADRSHARPTTSAFHTPTVSQSPQHQPDLLVSTSRHMNAGGHSTYWSSSRMSRSAFPGRPAPARHGVELRRGSSQTARLWDPPGNRRGSSDPVHRRGCLRMDRTSSTGRPRR